MVLAAVGRRKSAESWCWLQWVAKYFEFFFLRLLEVRSRQYCVTTLNCEAGKILFPDIGPRDSLSGDQAESNHMAG